MKYNILTLLILAIIASKFMLDYSFVIMGLIIAAVCIIFNMIPKHRFSSRLEKKINKALQQGPVALNEHIRIESFGSNVNQIKVFYDNETIGSLIEFESFFPESYKNFLTFIQDKIQQPVVSTQPVEQHIPLASYIPLIDSYNIEITDEEISLGLYHTSNQLKYLQKLLEEHPKTNKKIDKLENYYLPILMDILANYTKVLKTDEAAKSLHDQCLKSITLINEALKNIIHSLFEDEKMNLHADMSVLENLLKKDGLVQNEMSYNEFYALMEEKE